MASIRERGSSVALIARSMGAAVARGNADVCPGATFARVYALRMERLAKLVVGGVLAVSLLGCYGGHGGGGANAVATGVVVGAAIGAMAMAASNPPPPEPRYYGSTVYVQQAPPPLNYPPVTPAPQDDPLPAFDPAATRAALGAVDVTACGGPPGYGHARVTMNPDGVISRVVVEDPAQLSPQVADCVGRLLGRVTVEPFRGSMVVVGTSFRLN